MAAAPPTLIHDLAQELVDCVCMTLDDIAETTPDYPGCPTCMACVTPGLPALTNCCDNCSGTGGQLAVHVESFYPSMQFPEPDAAPMKCAPPLSVVQLVVTVARCAPMPDNQGNPPDCTKLDEAARIVHTDMWGVHQAIACCFGPAKHPTGRRRQWLLVGSAVLPPQGSCVASETRLVVDTGAPCICVDGGSG